MRWFVASRLSMLLELVTLCSHFFLPKFCCPALNIMPDWHSTLHSGCLWCWIKHKCITNMTVVCAQILLYLFGAHQSASSQIAMDTERTVHTTSVCYIWWVLVSFSGMVAALTNERTRSKSVYFAHCRDGNTYLLTEWLKEALNLHSSAMCAWTSSYILKRALRTETTCPPAIWWACRAQQLHLKTIAQRHHKRCGSQQIKFGSYCC